MFTIDITTNVYLFAAIVVASSFIGFFIRTSQIARSRARVILLEQEIRDNHAEILELQRDFIALELKMNVAKGPVIKMKNIARENNEKLLNVSLRKKLLTKENSQEKNETFSVVYNNLLGKAVTDF
jgi:hypothetical protein